MKVCHYLTTLFISVILYATNTQTLAQEAPGTSAARINPTRIVVPANQKSGSITLTNTANVEASYRMTMIEVGLDGDGTLRRLSDDEVHPDHRSAIPVVRFSPKQVRLKPGESQVIRAIVRRSGMESGEYRSHLTLQALPVVNTIQLAQHNGEAPVWEDPSAGFNIGVVVPVIIRHQDTQASVKLEKATFTENDNNMLNRVKLSLGLTGNRSTYGDITVSLISGRKESVIGKLNGFALYYPYSTQNITIPLSETIAKSAIDSNSSIRVQFRSRVVDAGQEFWLDEKITPVIQQAEVN